MKLALFLYSLETGGAERVTTVLANQWRRTGHDVSVVTIAPPLNDCYALDPGIVRHSLDLAQDSRSSFAGAAANAKRVRRLRQFIADIQPDAVVAMSSTCNVLLALANVPARTIAVGSERVHPPTVALPGAWSALRTHGYRWLDAIVTQTTRSMDWVRHHTRARHVAVIPNPVAFPLPVHDPIVQVRSTAATRQRLLAVGRLTEQKGFDILIDVFARLQPAFPEWELVILGSGPLRLALQQEIEQRGLADVILLPGAVGNLGEWYESADLFVLSSRFEGFPNTLIEAMAHGLPVISFDCTTGPAEIIRHGYNGMLVPAEDAVALERSLRSMLNDDSQRTCLAERAREVRVQYSSNSISEQWLQLFQQLTR